MMATEKHPASHQKILRYIFCTLLLIAAAANIVSQTVPAAENSGVITHCEVIGLTKTKLSVVQQALEPFMGLPADTINIQDVYAAITGTGILQPETIEIRESEDRSGSYFFLELTEKRSFFPVPIIMGDTNGNISGGVFIANMNAFGINDKMSLGGIFSAETILTMFIYSHNTQKAGFPDWSVSAFYRRGDSKNTDQKNNILRRWNAHALRTSVNVSYDFFDNAIRAALGLSYELSVPREAGNTLFPPENTAMRIPVSPRISYEKRGYDGFLSVTRSASLSYTAEIGINRETPHKIDFKGLYELSIIPGFKLNAETGAEYVTTEDLFSMVHPSAVAAIFPAAFAAKAYVAACAGFEKYIYQWKWGTLSAALNYQTAYSDCPGIGRDFDHGPGMEIAFYLSRVALPALAVSFNYNIDKLYFAAGFSLGASF